MRRARRIAAGALLAALLYLAVASIAFAFRHPELTETQRFLRMVDALAWR